VENDRGLKPAWAQEEAMGPRVALRDLFRRRFLPEPEACGCILEAIDLVLRSFGADTFRNVTVRVVPSDKHFSELARSQNR
jgi:hypothetical protein